MLKFDMLNFLIPLRQLIAWIVFSKNDRKAIYKVYSNVRFATFAVNMILMLGGLAAMISFSLFKPESIHSKFTYISYLIWAFLTAVYLVVDLHFCHVIRYASINKSLK